jgi:bifunctional NMN adenylyltransferase/nudix hydrolase
MHYDLAVFIGRFQPFHVGHQYVLDEALDMADNVLVLIGSSFEPRSLRNPWSFAEREAMIRSCYTPEDNARIICKPIRDIRYNDALWISQVQKSVYAVQKNDNAKITLIGKPNQSTNYYANFFPQWDNHDVVHDHDISSTDIRDDLFSDGHIHELADHIPAPILNKLNDFITTPDGQNLKNEYSFIEQYKKGWENAPFSPTHVTVDAVVVQSGHVLLTKRGAQPGKGLLALPGGFIHHEETLLNAIVRKLKEETQIKVPGPVLIGSVKGQYVFDAPFRSVRGRTITHAFHMELRNEESLPKIKGGGDTASCFWLPLAQLDSTQMYEDHYFIIQKMLGIN